MKRQDCPCKEAMWRRTGDMELKLELKLLISLTLAIAGVCVLSFALQS
jgi:hypothetical protein